MQYTYFPIKQMHQDTPYRRAWYGVVLLLGLLLISACSVASKPDSPATAPNPDAGSASNPVIPLPQTTPSPIGMAPAAIESPIETYPTPKPAPTIDSELLFLRGGSLLAYGMTTGQEREIAPDVQEFGATRDGQWIAMVRGDGLSAEVWVVARDGSELRQVTNNQRTESSLSWAPDGSALTYASTDNAMRYPLLPDWLNWAAWCSASDVRLLDIASGDEQLFERGCAPAFSTDGRRIAFVTPPTSNEPATSANPTPTENNTIRLINRQGQNGWSFAIARGATSPTGRLVYAAAWSPDGAWIAYHRFIGYQALTDVNLTEMGHSLEGGNVLLNAGAGWLLPPRFDPDGQYMAVVEHDFSDARGWGGYEHWQVSVLNLKQTGEVILPDGTRPAEAALQARLPRVTAAAWSPNGNEMIIALPQGWQPGASENEPLFVEQTAGSLWRWLPGQPIQEQLLTNVDFASPLLWLPAV